MLGGESLLVLSTTFVYAPVLKGGPIRSRIAGGRSNGLIHGPDVTYVPPCQVVGSYILRTYREDWGRRLSHVLVHHISSSCLIGRRGWDIAALRRPLVVG